VIHGTNQGRPLPQERVTRSEMYNRNLRDRQLQKGYKVPSLVPGGLVVCVGSGPSLEREDVEYAHAKGAAIIAVNDAYLYAPFALALMASDSAWWIHKKPEFAGLRFALDPGASRVKDVHVLKNTGTDGIETDPAGLRTCRNSGGAAVNLAVHFIGAAAGPRRIILLGYDMGVDKKKTHFFGHHKFPLRDGSPYDLFHESFKKQVAPLKEIGIDIVNCSRRTALSCFRREPLHQALP
jgi:hypothetical protein